jgi:hypothetical protein
VGSVAFLVSAVAGDPRYSRWALALIALSWPLFVVVRRFGAR